MTIQKDKLKRRLSSAALNLILRDRPTHELEAEPSKIDALRKIRSNPQVLDDIAKLYTAHLKHYPQETIIDAKGIHGEQTSFIYPEDENIFVENIASLLTIRYPIPMIPRQQHKEMLLAQINRAEQLIRNMKNAQAFMNTTLGDMYYDDWLTVRVDLEPTKTIREMGAIDDVLVKYINMLKERIETLSNLPQLGGATNDQRLLSASFRFITQEIFELTGKTRTTLVQRLIENVHGLYLGRNFGNTHRYKPPKKPLIGAQKYPTYKG